MADVVDGDTVRLHVDGVQESVRLVGINAPERGECLADEARALLGQLLAGGPIRLERDTSDRDRYGRLLRYVYTGDVLVNEALVEAGMAVAHRYEPDTANAGRLEAAQARAQAAGAGQWAPAACGPANDVAVEIVEVVYDAPGDDGRNLNGEWVVLRNAGVDAADLSGWMLKDTSASHRYRFPDGFTLAAGGRIALYSGCGDDNATALYWCEHGSAVWNNDGDTAFLLDPSGNIVASWPYEGR